MFEHVNECARNVGGCNKSRAWQAGAFIDHERGERRQIVDEAVRLNLLENVAETRRVHAREFAEDFVGNDLAIPSRECEKGSGLPGSFGDLHERGGEGL